MRLVCNSFTLNFALITLALYPSSMGNIVDRTAIYKTCMNLGKNQLLSETKYSNDPNRDRLAKFVYHLKLGNFFEDVEVKLKKSFVKCGETTYLQIVGLIQDQESAESTSTRTSLRFHPTLTSKNVMFLNNYATALKKTQDNQETNGYGYGVVVTERCLEDDEMFQVRLDESIPKWRTLNLGIGVLKNLPSDVSSWQHVLDKQGQWSLYSHVIYVDGKTIKSNYPFSTANLPDGTLLGVMRKSNGDLHFFQNGKDGGVAATGVPKCVYGFFDLINYSKKISIVK